MTYPSRALAVLLLALPLSGCAAAVVGAGAAGVAGAILYAKNEAKADYNAELEPVWQAAIAATERAGYPVPANPTLSSVGGEFEAGDARVVVEKHTGGKTRVRVRVGTFRTDDHKRLAKLILEDIGRQVAGG